AERRLQVVRVVLQRCLDSPALLDLPTNGLLFRGVKLAGSRTDRGTARALSRCRGLGGSDVAVGHLGRLEPLDRERAGGAPSAHLLLERVELGVAQRMLERAQQR